ncbi:MAG: CHAT domain-containing protein [Proteobacteria bacterium]|nr:CHAT domain-containing protein [Pseudomonadota bacterium]
MRQSVQADGEGLADPALDYSEPEAWAVFDSKESATLGVFYVHPTTHLLAEALRQAQLAMMRNQKYGDPSYWSPYLMIGNWLQAADDAPGCAWRVTTEHPFRKIPTDCHSNFQAVHSQSRDDIPLSWQGEIARRAGDSKSSVGCQKHGLPAPCSYRVTPPSDRS